MSVRFPESWVSLEHLLRNGTLDLLPMTWQEGKIHPVNELVWVQEFDCFLPHLRACENEFGIIIHLFCERILHPLQWVEEGFATAIEIHSRWETHFENMPIWLLAKLLIDMTSNFDGEEKESTFALLWLTQPLLLHWKKGVIFGLMTTLRRHFWVDGRGWRKKGRERRRYDGVEWSKGGGWSGEREEYRKDGGWVYIGWRPWWVTRPFGLLIGISWIWFWVRSGCCCFGNYCILGGMVWWLTVEYSILAIGFMITWWSFPLIGDGLDLVQPNWLLLSTCSDTCWSGVLTPCPSKTHMQ